jgi:hypothetical protein
MRFGLRLALSGNLDSSYGAKLYAESIVVPLLENDPMLGWIAAHHGRLGADGWLAALGRTVCDLIDLDRGEHRFFACSRTGRHDLHRRRGGKRRQFQPVRPAFRA